MSSQISGTETAEEQPVATKYFIYSIQYHIAICKQCKHAVWPQEVARHLQNPEHRMRPKQAREMRTVIRQWPEIIYNIQDLPSIRPLGPPVPGLQLYQDGLQCQVNEEDCQHICRAENSIKAHLTRKHPGYRGRRGRQSLAVRQTPIEQPWKAGVRCQRIFIQGRGSQYFEVLAPAEPEDDAPATATRVEQAKQVLIQRMDLIREEERRTIEASQPREANPWLKRTEWTECLARSDTEPLLASIEEPDVEKDPIGAAIWVAIGGMIEHCQQSICTHVNRLIKMEAVRSVKHQTKYQPLQPYMDARAIQEHSRPWKQAVMFIVRTQREHGWTSPKYKMDRQVKSTFGALRAAAVTEVERVSEAYSSGRSVGSSHGRRESGSSRGPGSDGGGEKAVRLDGIQASCLRFCIALLRQKSGNKEYRNPLVCALAVLGKNPEGWKTPADYPPILSRMIKIARFMVIQQALQIADLDSDSGSVAEEQPRCVDIVGRMMDDFMIKGTHGAMEWMLDLRTYGLKIHYSTTAVGHVDWHGDTVVYKDIRFSIPQFRGMVHGLVGEARRLLIEDIMDDGPGGGRVPRIPWSALFDDPSQGRPGWSFIHDRRTTWEVDGTWWLFQRFTDQDSRAVRLLLPDPGTEIRWDWKSIWKWMDRVKEFREKLLICLHVTGGQPARGPELLSILMANSSSETRGIFVEDGMVVFMTQYHKGYSISGNVKIIHRYLPRAVGELVVYYLWLVLPLQQRLEAEVHQRHSQSYHLWPTDPDGTEWTSARMRSVIRRESRAGMGVELTIQSYRELAIGISRRYMHGAGAFRMDEEDEEGELNEDEATDLQAGHTSHVAGMIYARGIRERDGAVASKRARFREASETWHRLLGFEEEAAGVPGRTRKRAAFDDIGQEAAFQRWKRARGTNVEEALQGLMGERCAFRGVQRAAIEAVMKGEPRVAAVMGTGGGKSLIFMLPAWVGGGGCSIVVVPLIGLRQDMVRRCRESGIECEEWNSRRPPDGARIVLVTPEAALTGGFHTFVNRLKATQRLDRIVIDECHIILNNQTTFRAKLREMGRLNGAEVQIVMLTATLPPSMEGELWQRMGLQGTEVRMFRGRTTRANIQYRIHRFHGRKAADTEGELVALIRRKLDQYAGGKVIIYCNSVGKTVRLAEVLACQAYYHDAESKTETLQALTSGRARMVVATSAFGLGIDIPDIRVIIHADIPRNLLEYGQESGRAGRDGGKSEAIIAGQQGWQEKVTGVQDAQEKEMIEQFMAGSCQRVVLDGFMDEARERSGCEDGEERCEGCRGGEEEDREDKDNKTISQGQGSHPGLGQGSIHMDLGHEPGRSEEAGEQAEFHQQHIQVSRIRSQGVSQQQLGGVEMEDLRRHLEARRGRCDFCMEQGIPDEHSIYRCMASGSAGPVQEYRDMKAAIRQGRTMARFGGCQWCFVPQAWCNRWEAGSGEGEGWRMKKEVQDCRYQDSILGGFIVRCGTAGYRSGLQERMSKSGFDITSRTSVLGYIGQKIRWNGVEAWKLMEEYWEGVQSRNPK